MVNVGFSFASFLGIVFAIGGAGLYFLRQFRPALARDYDVFFAAIGLSIGIILFFFGWQLEPVHQINTLLMTCTVFFFAYEGIRLRGIAVEQAKRRTPVVDDERPVSRVYRAELDDWDELNGRSTARPRMRPYGDSYREDDYGEERYRDRPPYEEPRYPAGRLKPSEDPGRRRRPPENRYSEERPSSGSSNMGNSSSRDADLPPPRSRRPPESDDDRRPPSSAQGGSRRESSERSSRSDRTFNVRPRPEGPDLPPSSGEGGYVDFRPVNPPDQPPEDPQNYRS